MANQMLEMIHGMLYGKGLRIGKLSSTGAMVAQMTGKRADRVPFLGAQLHDHAMTLAKVPARKYYSDASLLVTTQFAVNRWYKFDAGMIMGDAYNLEAEALGAKMIYSDNAMPTIDRNYPLIKNPGDLDKLGSIDLSKGRIPYGIELGRLVSELVPPPFGGGFFCSQWSLICNTFGYSNAIRALRRDKVFAAELFDYIENEVLFPYLKAQAEVGIKNSQGADAWAAFPNITPEIAEEWVYPSARRLRDRAKKELGMNAMSAFLSCDYCEEDPEKFNKEMMFKCWSLSSQPLGLDVLFSGMGRTHDWNPEWMQEFAVEYGSKGRKRPILGSFNGTYIKDSTPQTIIEKIRQWIDIMGRDGGLLLFIGSNVPASTPPINVHTVRKAIKVLGQYPIAGDLNSIVVEPPQFQPFDEWLKGQPEEEMILKAREWKPSNKKVFT